MVAGHDPGPDECAFGVQLHHRHVLGDGPDDLVISRPRIDVGRVSKIQCHQDIAAVIHQDVGTQVLVRTSHGACPEEVTVLV